MVTKEVDLAIIGAGPAGMAAAISAVNAGLDNIAPAIKDINSLCILYLRVTKVTTDMPRSF